MSLEVPAGKGSTGMSVRTKWKLFVAVLLAATCVYFVVRTPGAKPLGMAEVESPAPNAPLGSAAVLSGADDLATEAGQRSLVPEELSDGEFSLGESALRGTKVLRVALEGITEEEARMTRVKVTGVDRRAFDLDMATPKQKHDYVKWIQGSLNDVLETQLVVDGMLGGNTRKAIIAFQEREGLPNDGRVSLKMQESISQQIGPHMPAPHLSALWPAEIQDSWTCQGLTSEFDLNPFFKMVAERDGDLRVDELEVHLDHGLYHLERIRVPLSRGVQDASGQTVYEVRVSLVPAGVVHGRVVRANGTSAADGLVGAILLERGFPIEDIAGAVECGVNGAFTIRVAGSGSYALACFEKGFRPTTTHVEVIAGTRINVGTLVLESGHTISGHVLARGNPLTGASVSSTPPRWRTAATPEAISRGMRQNVYEGRTFTTPTRSVHLLWLTQTTTHRGLSGARHGGRFELSPQSVDVDENGAFTFGGLGPIEYLLRMGELAEANDSLPGYWGNGKRDDEMVYTNGGKAGLPVRAPKLGVVLEFRETLIRFELSGDLESEDEGRLVLRARSANPTPVDETGKDLRLVADPLAKNLNFTPEFHTRGYALSGAEPTYVLQAPPNKHMMGEVAFPGRKPVPLDFSTPEPGGEVVIPVELVPAGELATLVIELENPQAEITETFSVLLWRAGLEDGPPDTRTVEALGGQLRVEGIFPGRYRVRVRTGVDRNYPTGLFFDYELDLELYPGRAATRSIRLQKCAGLRVSVRDGSGELVGGEFEFFDHLGGRANLLLEVGEGQRHGYSYSIIYPYGIHESVNPLKPGRYRLVLVSPGFSKQSVMVELRSGAYEDVDVTLSK